MPLRLIHKRQKMHAAAADSCGAAKFEADLMRLYSREIEYMCE